MFDKPTPEDDGSYNNVSMQLFNKSDGENDPPKAPLQTISTKDLVGGLADNEPWDQPMWVRLIVWMIQQRYPQKLASCARGSSLPHRLATRC